MDKLGEIAKIIYPDDGYDDEIWCDLGSLFREKWLEGAKYQQDKLYTEEDILKASQYGYEYHQNTNFPDTSWEDNCKNNTRQWLTTLKEQ